MLFIILEREELIGQFIEIIEEGNWGLEEQGKIKKKIEVK